MLRCMSCRTRTACWACSTIQCTRYTVLRHVDICHLTVSRQMAYVCVSPRYVYLGDILGNDVIWCNSNMSILPRYSWVLVRMLLLGRLSLAIVHQLQHAIHPWHRLTRCHGWRYSAYRCCTSVYASIHSWMSCRHDILRRCYHDDTTAYHRCNSVDTE